MTDPAPAQRRTSLSRNPSGGGQIDPNAQPAIDHNNPFAFLQLQPAQIAQLQAQFALFGQNVNQGFALFGQNVQTGFQDFATGFKEVVTDPRKALDKVKDFTETKIAPQVEKIKKRLPPRAVFLIHLTTTLLFAATVIIAFAVTLSYFRKTQEVHGVFYNAVNYLYPFATIYLNVQTITPETQRMTFEGEITSCPLLMDSRRRILLDFQIRVYGGQTFVTNYSKGDLLSSFSLNIRLVNGSINDYPFDSYASSMNMEIIITDESYNGLPLDYELLIETRLVNGFKAQFPDPADKAKAKSVTGSKLIVINVNRTGIFIMYPVFVIIGMWAVSIVAFGLAARVAIYRNRRAELPMLIVYSGMTFALPMFRNSAPLAPPIGCLMDFSSFFWTEFITIASFTAIFGTFILQKPVPAPAPPPSAPMPVRSQTTPVPIFVSVAAMKSDANVINVSESDNGRGTGIKPSPPSVNKPLPLKPNGTSAQDLTEDDDKSTHDPDEDIDGDSLWESDERAAMKQGNYLSLMEGYDDDEKPTAVPLTSTSSTASQHQPPPLPLKAPS
mmetsp:Transcript_27950/g.45375  ORF Transcript_27950/g.45375 Transcript_27950/m.45375 type:complete len:555 (+) Transcript_27950:91-1755(+)